MVSVVKENPGRYRAAEEGAQVRLVAGLAACGAFLLLAIAVDSQLPEPRFAKDTPPTSFIAEYAMQHLKSLTDLGPRVAGSYENEVLSVTVLTERLKEIARGMTSHHVLDIDVLRADGNYSLTFLDGMSTAYRGVSAVVARLRGAGARPAPAVLLNCHYDTVPDSPGASDDALGCAVGLEVVRALGASPAPLRHDVLLLLNGAEENIMQGSHAFLTNHPWSKLARVFVNMEACGAGGREVLFQATPHGAWLLEEYAASVPRPLAVSLAQEVFESGLVPGDTDFRIFRDIGNLSGVDLAWVSDGYAYHTALDDAARVSAASCQRTGDNVLALLRGVMSRRSLRAAAAEESWGAPVYFDVLGLHAVVVRAPIALVVAALLLLLAPLQVHRAAPPHLRGAWWGAVCRCAAALLVSLAAGAAAAWAGAALLALGGARMLPYAHPTLLLPLAAPPGMMACWVCVRWLHGRSRLRAALAGWRHELALAALRVLWAALLAAAVAARLRSGFVAGVWAAALALGGAGGGAGAALYFTYVARDMLAFVVPVVGRAGDQHAPDVALIVLTSVIVLIASCWLLPTVLEARSIKRVVCALALVYGATLAGCLLVARGGGGAAAYSAMRPQRLVALHVARTEHGGGGGGEGGAQHLLWVPDLDVNTHRTLRYHLPVLSEMGVQATSTADCSRWVYCGAPYFLPALSVVPHAHIAPAPPHNLAHVDVTLRKERAHRACNLTLTVTGEKHIVVIVSPSEGARLTGSSLLTPLQPGPRWGRRDTYMLTLFDSRVRARRQPWVITFYIELAEGAGGEGEETVCASLSVSGHCMSGRRARSPLQARVFAAAPAWVSPTGWTVDTHLYHM